MSSHYSVYKFPELEDLPDGLCIDMFRERHPKYLPGHEFISFDRGDICKLIFLHRGAVDSIEHSCINKIDRAHLVSVYCKKVRDLEDKQKYLTMG